MALLHLMHVLLAEGLAAFIPRRRAFFVAHREAIITVLQAHHAWTLIYTSGCCGSWGKYGMTWPSWAAAAWPRRQAGLPSPGLPASLGACSSSRRPAKQLEHRATLAAPCSRSSASAPLCMLLKPAACMRLYLRAAVHGGSSVFEWHRGSWFRLMLAQVAGEAGQGGRCRPCSLALLAP